MAETGTWFFSECNTLTSKIVGVGPALGQFRHQMVLKMPFCVELRLAAPKV